MPLRSLVLAALSTSFLVVAAKVATPRFKWGQNKELIFLSVMVRDLDPSSVKVSTPTVGELSFNAKSSKGEEFALDLALREDIKADSMKYEIMERSDKWGTPIMITLSKANQHRWDLLVTNPKKYKDRMDKDWAREDQALEPEDEIPYAEDHSAYISSLTSKNLDKTLAKFGAVVVNVRYPWCTQCKSQDDTFAKTAKLAKSKGKKDAAWKKVAFAVVDAREERDLARRLGAKCDYTCEYRVFAGGEEEPTLMKSKWSESELLAEISKYTLPAVTSLKSQDELSAIKSKNTTCFGGFKSEDSPTYKLFKKVANMMRGELVFAATFGEEKTVELWPHKQNFSFKYDGSFDDNGTALYDWVRPRSMPLLQAYDWQLREAYEKLGLPLAKVFINDEDKNPSFEKIVRHAVRRVAKKYIGKLAFVELKKSTNSYELRDFGLNQPEVYPCFGIASNASYNSIKYGFEVTADVAASNQEFWKDADKAVEHLTKFCEQMLAGSWPEAHESGAVQTNWTQGAVKQLVWKTYKEVKSPDKPLLLEIYGKYRAENEKKQKEVENLAKALEPFAASFSVASYDTSDNYLPPSDFKREKYSSDTEWYWLPGAGDEKKKLMKPKKDAPIKNVIEFVKKQSGVSEFDEKAINAKFEELMQENPPPPTTPPPPDTGFTGRMPDTDAMEGMDGLGDMAGMADAMKGMAGMGMGGMGDLGKMDL